MTMKHIALRVLILVGSTGLGACIAGDARSSYGQQKSPQPAPVDEPQPAPGSEQQRHEGQQSAGQGKQSRDNASGHAQQANDQTRQPADARPPRLVAVKAYSSLLDGLRQRGTPENAHICGGFAHRTDPKQGRDYLTFTYAFRHCERNDVTLVGDLDGFNFDKRSISKGTSDSPAATMTVQGTLEIITGDHETLPCHVDIEFPRYATSKRMKPAQVKVATRAQALQDTTGMVCGYPVSQLQAE